MDESIISENELRSRLTNYEDPFVERKVDGDLKDCLKTAVAFANTLPNGIPGVIFIPVKNDGTIKTGINLDELQRSISKRLADAYPALLYFQRIVTVEETQLIAVVVPGSPQRPHFAGPAYVRDGSQSVKASENQFALLIARRSAMVEELNKWVSKTVSMFLLRPHFMGGPRVVNIYDAEVIECTQWWLTLRYLDQASPVVESFALSRVQLAFDHKRNRLGVEIET